MKSNVIQPAVPEAVVTQIRLAIVDGTLPPGSRIKQEELAARLNVSRAPIRQALMVLKREGLVEIRHHRGAIVSPLDLPFISDIYELREVIEGHVVTRLAERTSFDPTPLWQIVADGHEANASGHLSRVIELDLAFHKGIYDALGNRPLTNIMDAQWCHVRRVMAATLTVNNNRGQVWDDHSGILKAIAAGKPEEARAASISHTRAARDVLLQNLKDFVTNQALARHSGAKRHTRLERAPRGRSGGGGGSNLKKHEPILR
jgi:DNA-binding GntR family transcriptional regulator